MAQSFETIPLRRIDGTPTDLSAFAGQVKLIVNVASQCGLTPQYAGLEALFERYRAQGFVVLGFPANEFGAQEPGANAEIAQFCETRFGVQFPMFEKVAVKGAGIHPLFAALTEAQPIGEGAANDIRWNFEKFIVGRHGDVVARLAPTVAPDDAALLATIEAEIAKG